MHSQIKRLCLKSWFESWLKLQPSFLLMNILRGNKWCLRNPGLLLTQCATHIEFQLLDWALAAAGHWGVNLKTDYLSAPAFVFQIQWKSNNKILTKWIHLWIFVTWMIILWLLKKNKVISEKVPYISSIKMRTTLLFRNSRKLCVLVTLLYLIIPRLRHK